MGRAHSGSTHRRPKLARSKPNRCECDVRRTPQRMYTSAKPKRVQPDKKLIPPEPPATPGVCSAANGSEGCQTSIPILFIGKSSLHH